ncbi:MAG: NADPH-dependent FMN reductase [Saprospiraceae bacterium]
MKTILAINGSASRNSSNSHLLNFIKDIIEPEFQFEIIENLYELPSFQTVLTNENTPDAIIELRSKIEAASGVLFCTPEYVFSIPSGLKNILEWCVSTVVFSNKKVAIITASAHGVKGHEELQMILKTIYAQVLDEHTLLIQGVKGKFDASGTLKDKKTEQDLQTLVQSFLKTI